jgi:galactokinase
MTRVGEPARFELLRAALGGSSDDLRFARAPGRVNLIGDHTDYQGGLCLPMAIDRDVLIGFRAGSHGQVRVHSLDLDAELTDGPWARPVEATIAVLARRASRPFPGFDAAVTSTVPIGAGLSSSAAFGVALAIVTATVAGLHLAPAELALAAQEVEQLATGVPCGMMDQFASVFGQLDHALLLDCRTLTMTPVRMPSSVGVLVLHSGVERQLATSEYAARREACETAAARLGVATLRDATFDQVADDPFARHVVSENARVEAFAGALAAGDVATAGALMLASHGSLRDDFAVSTSELDLLVDLSVDAGAYGARLTGAGFGGCVIALVARPELDVVAATVSDRYRAETGREPVAFGVCAVEGAGLVGGPARNTPRQRTEGSHADDL